MSDTRPVSTAVRERLEAELPQGTRIHSAASMPSDRAQLRPPALYVIPRSARAAPNTLANGVAQRVTDTVAVVIAARAVNEPLQARAREDVEEWRSRVRAALLGWQPAGCAPLTYAGGELVSVGRANAVVWAERYVTESQWRAVPGAP